MTDNKAALDAPEVVLKRCAEIFAQHNLVNEAYEIDKYLEALTTPPAPTMLGDGEMNNNSLIVPCSTCNSDPESCADVPSLRHCEAANRETVTQPPQATDAQEKALEAFEEILDGNFRYQRHYESAVAEVKAALQSPAVPREVVDALRSAQQALREWREDFTPEVKIQSPAEVLVSRAMTALGCSGEETA